MIQFIKAIDIAMNVWRLMWFFLYAVVSIRYDTLIVTPKVRVVPR